MRYSSPLFLTAEWRSAVSQRFRGPAHAACDLPPNAAKIPTALPVPRECRIIVRFTRTRPRTFLQIAMPTRSEDFAGLTVAMITPFRDGQVDIEALQQNVEFQIAPARPAFAPWARRASAPPSRTRSTSG